MIEDKLAICKQTREIAANAFADSLSSLLEQKTQISEADLARDWLGRLRQVPQIYPDGWYAPPPHGMAVLFATEQDPGRASPKSTRPEEYWPRDDIFLDKQTGLMMVYASPVNKQTGIIGDFGLSVYLGRNPEIAAHLQKTASLAADIYRQAEVGMSFADVATNAKKLMDQKGIYNDLASPSDPAGTNIGHTIPGSYEEWSNEQEKVLSAGENDWPAVCELIRGSRRFVSTIEPRPQVSDRPDLPMVWFHTIAMFHQDGQRELITGFDRIFEIAGMEYMTTSQKSPD